MSNGLSQTVADHRPCQLDRNCIDSFDCIEGNEVLALIWCDTHEEYHWNWVPRNWREARI